MALVTFGAQNQVFSGNPDKTFFYQVFKRHTHFAAENITIPVDGPNELLMDQQIRVRAKIPRHADLLTDLVLVFDLPEIYSKVYTDISRNPSFRWIHHIGAQIIQYISIYVGGTKVQDFPGEWLSVRATADYTADKYMKWRNMIGDVPELHSPEWGIYGKSPNYPFAKGEYPYNVADPGGATTAPSIPGRTIRVPLPFWFTESWGTALPLVALQLHEVEVQITLRSIRDLFRIYDPVFNAEPVRPGKQLLYDPRFPTQLDPNVPVTPPNNLTLQNAYASYDDTATLDYLRNYFTAAGIIVPLNDAFNINLHLEGNYIYITEKEQRMFAERALQFLVHQVQTFNYYSVLARTRFDMEIHGLSTRLLLFARRSDALVNRNDVLNLSNWKNLTQAPFYPVSGPTPATSNAGLMIPNYGNRDILSSVRLWLAGNALYEEKPAQFFEVQVPYMNGAGVGIAGLNPGALKPDDVMGPLYQFPLALNMSDHEQPSGSLNASRLREIQLEVNPNPPDPNGYYVYDFTIYVESMNTVKIQNGMGGVGWAI